MIERIAFGSPTYELALGFREEHLRRPLGLVLSAEDVAGEAEQIHIVALEGGATVVGTVVMKPVSSTEVKLRQMAVSPQRRGTGLGSDLVRFAERIAVEQGFETIELHARTVVEPFYVGLGYTRVGQPFVEITVLHVTMVKQLQA